ncbi:zinc finger, C2H2 type [Oesophagostomum dentatum]|uniref:Zinc finger, C2H2 type n=1 Tax=Oesophagostomum dentatum TaxID=61180 RepID=A0A0B1SPK3_OESDE|nr:zinc finger, C2H2 type [Oesophagostomum dentatum]
MYTAAKCCICEKGPYPLKTLYAHMRRVHKCVEADIAKVQHAIKKACYDGKDEERAHTKVSEDSNKEPAEKINHTVECPVCNQPFYSTMELAYHCRDEHDDGTTDFTIIVKMFDSWTDFEMWREQKELETFSKLVKRTYRKSNCWTTITYTCQHSRGSSKDLRELKKRARRKTRLCRNCPCFAKVKHRRDEVVEVIACFGHCGHPHPAYMTAREGERQIPLTSNDVADTSSNDLYPRDTVNCTPVAVREGKKQVPLMSNDVANVKPNDLYPSDGVDSSPLEGSSHTQSSTANEQTDDDADEEIVNLLKMGEVVQVFVEEQRYDLMNKFSDILEICLQQVPPELVNQVYFRTPSNAHTDAIPDGVEI